MVTLEGICPIAAMPFTRSGAIDFDSLRQQIRSLKACHALTLFGIAGEFYKLSDAERLETARVFLDETRSAGIASIVSVTTHATDLAVQEARQWQTLGADTLMLLPPFFLKPSAAAIEQHIAAVADAVDIPIMLQYAPEQTGVTIAPATMQRLSERYATLEYFKIECRPPGPYISDLYARTRQQAKIFVGNAGFQMIEAFDRGAIGVMPGASMFDLYLKVYSAYHTGDRTRAFAIHDVILRMLNHIRQDVEMIIAYEKRILQRRGIIATDVCRTPGFVSDPQYDAIFDELYDYVSGFFEPINANAES
ncbi:MAG TPA: dihydrodipicolinate synthase family protein [Aggregatilineales bacterium]|nr:dihydrodipicolinate synthase family protein [Aggregatilineales bacterium]